MKAQFILWLALIAVMLIPVSQVQAGDKDKPSEAGAFVEALKQSHGPSYWDKELMVIKDLNMIYGGKPALAGDFYFDVNLGVARMELKNGTVVIFKDGEAWANEIKDPKSAPMLRFHVLTWPWFAASAYKAKHSILNPITGQSFKSAGDNYEQMRQTFSADAGDSPDDWYVLFRDPKTGLLAGQSYIVTYGKSGEKLDAAQAKASVIIYEDYQSFDGVKLSKRWLFYPWDKDQGIAGKQKISVTIGDYAFKPMDEKLFEVPEGWKKIALPGK